MKKPGDVREHDEIHTEFLRCWSMRLLVTLSTMNALGGLHAQPPTIATLLSLVDCLDTACVSERLRPMNYCFKGGKERDGWMWYSCDRLDPLADHEQVIFVVSSGNYRDHGLITGDTVHADALTAELYHLGFTLDRALRSKEHAYGNPAYPTLEVNRSEKRSGAIHYKWSTDPGHARALPKDTLGCDHEHLQRMAQDAGYDSYELTQDLRWVFKVRVPTPNLGILPGEKDEAIKLRYLGGEEMVEFTIRDLSGKEVLRSWTQGWLTEVDVTGLSNGVHYLTIFSKWGMLCKTFMKN